MTSRAEKQRGAGGFITFSGDSGSRARVRFAGLRIRKAKLQPEPVASFTDDESRELSDMFVEILNGR